MKEAMKAKDKVRLETIRGVLSAIQYEEIEKKVEPLPDPAILDVLQREIKKRREELEFADKAGRPELKDKLHQEISAIESFLPKQLSVGELEKIVVELHTQNPAMNMGVLMKTLKDKYAGQYDARSASEIVKKVLG